MAVNDLVDVKTERSLSHLTHLPSDSLVFDVLMDKGVDLYD